LQTLPQGKLWAYSDPQRRLSKRKKDELDLIRLAETHPELNSAYPSALKELIDRG
jgi:NAD(P)H-dependent FMN reductase